MAGHFEKSYSVVITSQVSELFACFLAGVFVAKIGTRITLSASLCLASLAGLIIAVGG